MDIKEQVKKYFNGDEMAADVFLKKYSYEQQETPEDMHMRMTKEFYRVDRKYQEKEKRPSHLSEYGCNREDLTEDSIFNLFKDFKYIVPQGSVMATLGTDIVASLSNCVVTPSPYDSVSGINHTDGQLMNLYKRRCGVGVDISTLRPKGASTNNTSATSTGAVSFMERFSNTTREISMGSRRGALMLSIDVNHPDMTHFATIKSDLDKVTGANISIRFRDEFMKAVENDEDYILRFPCDFDLSEYNFDNIPYDVLQEGEFDGVRVEYKKVRAWRWWWTVVKQARDNAEPGLMFWDNVIDNDPSSVYEDYRPITSNPCGEQYLNALDSCRLIAVNLFSFVDNPFTEDAEVCFEKVYEVFYEAMRLGDNLVDLELEYIDRIIDKIKSDPEPDYIKGRELDMWKEMKNVANSGRRVGLGITALGDMLSALGLKYDEDKAFEVVEKVMKTKMRAELDCNIDMGLQRGTFENWDKDKEFLSKMDSYGEPTRGRNGFYQMILDEFPNLAKRMYKYGRRNSNWSTIAPTGSCSILTQTTSGCEPVFKAMYKRRRKVDESEEGVQVDFVDDVGDAWQEYFVLHHKFKDWIEYNWQNLGFDYSENPEFEVAEALSKEQLKEAFKKSPWYGSEAEDIDWIKRVEMQQILGRYTTNSISSTINLPQEVTIDEVKEIYEEAYNKGLKGVTIYRDGSRSGVLVSDEEKKVTTDRPEVLDCHIYHNQSKGDKFTTIIGLVDGKPYEIFCIPGFIATHYDEGKMTKLDSGDYRLDTAPDESYGVFHEVTNKMPGLIKNLCISWSYNLRYGVPVEKLVDKIGLVDESLHAFAKVVQRNLKNYIEDGAKSSSSCPECSEDTIVYEEGCKKCMSCGWSAC